MIKKSILSIFLLLLLIPLSVYASIGSLVKVGNKYYETLEEAISHASANDTITLISDVNLDETININKTININLNGNDITAPERVFLVQGGELNITGTGTIKETKPNYGAIIVKGSTNLNDKQYSTVNIGENVTLEGWSGIFITHDNNKSYGVDVNFAGTINSVDDTSGGTGIGIYVNGNIKDEKNSPVVTILDGAKINSTGNGLYIAGYGTFNINEANISGTESGIGIKSGVLNIDGATISSNGPDKTPTGGYNNGIKASGTAIQIESNSGYAGNIELNIDDGTFISNDSFTIYEYIGAGSTSQVIAMDISGGTFISKDNKPNISITDSLKEYHNAFISGGKYSKNPEEYLKPGYTTTIEDDTYVVTKSTMAVFNDKTKESHSIKIILICITIIIISTLIVYFNRSKILTLFKK